MTNISLRKVVGQGYKDYWEFKGRYRVCKGGRGSKKSTTTALNIIHRMMKYPLANTLVVRKVFKDHRDSTFKQLKWATRQLGVYHLWDFKVSPMVATYTPTGQSIYFRGLDDPMSITSITVEDGYLCWAWFEEAYQIQNEDDFDKVDMSIRGELPDGYFKQLTLTFNPWNEKHWLKKRFFDVDNPQIMAKTTNYMANEFLGQDDIDLFEWMKKHNPRRYKIEGLGDWGIAEGAVYNNWQELLFDKQEIAKRPGVKAAFGLDFGYTNDPSALSCAFVDLENREIFLFDEHYEQAMLNKDIAKMIKNKGYSKELIIADSSEPKSIKEIQMAGIRKAKKAIKGPDSVKYGIQFVQQFKIFVHPSCTNFVTELSNYVWDRDKENKLINTPIDEYNHLLDALRYSLEPFRKKVRL
ncbi:PBSX family phage terminase large subunit [Halobacillus karajensis]|uniref:Phage terminase, large subunit, PBSX family n=1 Tax=Halobacillus karajensis TaxID=195088 RepID=A0A059NXR7_9BACI|nr:PBSX family phage terminase large subunit [Halobacillus karajensis]CDQ22581.1 phage terminase, large subunit, PBSX family [Halobacillus karajensis]CDQ26063.1 phage terminase, large subunit, PBSX family [Halobacillus karajensis]